MKRKILKYSPWALPTLAFLILCIFVNNRMDMLLDSDMSSELILSKLLSEEFGVLSRNWYYSTEIRVLNTQLIYTPLFWIFKDWHAVRMTANVILYLIMSASFIFFCHTAKLDKYTPYLLTILLLPISWTYFDFVLNGLYYIPHVSISFVFLGIVMILVKTENKRKQKILFIILSVLSLLAGMGGLRQPIVLFVPFFISSMILWLRNKTEKNKRFFICGSAGLVCSIAGLFVNIVIFNLIYNFSTFDNISYVLPSFDNFWNILLGVLITLGYSTGPVFSASTLINLACLIIISSAFIAGYVCLSKKESDDHSQIVLFFICAVVVFCLLYSVTTTPYTERYNIPIVLFLLPILAIACEKTDFKKAIKNMAIAITVSGTLILGAKMYVTIGKVDKTAEFRQTVEYLKANGYDSGYASFWNANVLTELSDGDINMRIWAEINDYTIENPQNIYKWLQKTEHIIPEDGRFFVLLGKSEYEGVKNSKILDTENIVYQTDNYILFSYNNLDEYYSVEKCSPNCI